MNVLDFLKVLWLVLCFLADSSCAELRTIRAQSGQDITLSFQVPNNNTGVVQLNRTDLGKDQYVYASRRGTVLKDDQHPAFKGRVVLQMKDGNVSFTLENVTINDTGTYEGRAFMEDTQSWINDTIYLSVTPPPGLTGVLAEVDGKEDGGKEDGGKEGGPVGLIVYVPVAAVLVAAVPVAAVPVAAVLVAAVPVAAVGLLIYRQLQQSRFSQHPDKEKSFEMHPLQSPAAAPNSVLPVIPENDG